MNEKQAESELLQKALLKHLHVDPVALSEQFCQAEFAR